MGAHRAVLFQNKPERDHSDLREQPSNSPAGYEAFTCSWALKSGAVEGRSHPGTFEGQNGVQTAVAICLDTAWQHTGRWGLSGKNWLSNDRKLETAALFTGPSLLMIMHYLQQVGKHRQLTCLCSASNGSGWLPSERIPSFEVMWIGLSQRNSALSTLQTSTSGRSPVQHKRNSQLAAGRSTSMEGNTAPGCRSPGQCTWFKCQPFRL